MGTEIMLKKFVLAAAQTSQLNATMRNMMKFSLLIVGLGFPSPSLATLIDHGDGTINDSDTHLMWLQDANLSKTSGYDTDGLMTWSAANTWAQNLTFAGYDDWRLWRTPIDSTCTGTTCRDSELGDLFEKLGGEAGKSIYNTHNEDFHLFSNVQGMPGQAIIAYYSKTPFPFASPNYYWTFNLGFGDQGGSPGNVSYYAWAVRPYDDDDPSKVPEPATMLLFGTGIASLAGIRLRRKKA